MTSDCIPEGIRCIIATLITTRNGEWSILKDLEKKLTIVRREAKKIDEKFRVYLGSEIFFWAGCCRKIEIRSCAVDE